MSVAAKPLRIASGCGRRINSTTETSAGTAPDYSTTFPANCKDSRHTILAILLSQWTAKRKEESENQERPTLACPAVGEKPHFSGQDRKKWGTRTVNTTKPMVQALLRFCTAHRRLIHRRQQILRMPVIVRVNRPHPRPAQPELPVGIHRPVVSRELVVISDVAIAAVRHQQIRHKRQRIAITLPSLFIDPALDRGSIA